MLRKLILTEFNFQMLECQLSFEWTFGWLLKMKTPISTMFGTRLGFPYLHSTLWGGSHITVLTWVWNISAHIIIYPSIKQRKPCLNLTNILFAACQEGPGVFSTENPAWLSAYFVLPWFISKCRDLILSRIKPRFPSDTDAFLPLPALTDDRIRFNFLSAALQSKSPNFMDLGHVHSLYQLSSMELWHFTPHESLHQLRIYPKRTKVHQAIQRSQM